MALSLPSLPCAGEAGREFCFMSVGGENSERRLRCNMFGQLAMSGNREGSEVWRFVVDDSGSFVISSWHDNQKMLGCDAEGKVSAAKKRSGDQLQKWQIVQDHGTHFVRIQSVEHGKTLACGADGPRAFDSEGEGVAFSGDSVWRLEPAHQNQFFISATCHNRRLSSTKDKLCARLAQGSHEKWAIAPVASAGPRVGERGLDGVNLGQFTIRSLEHGTYLGSSEGGYLILSGSGPNRPHWTIISRPNGGVFIQSEGEKLSCDDNGNLEMTAVDGDMETWRLEPVMPNRETIDEKLSTTIVGATFIMAVIIMPSVAVSLVRAAGFGTRGIATGSLAAKIMSARARACGGGVSTGGIVATLQRIGHAGLGAAGMVIWRFVGGMLGWWLSLRGVTMINDMGNEQERIKFI